MESLYGSITPSKVRLDDEKTLVQIQNVQDDPHSICFDGNDVVSTGFKALGEKRSECWR
jgi:hypothetical protein